MPSLNDKITHNFKWSEVLVDVISRRQISTLNDVPTDVQERLQGITEVAQKIREYFKIAFRCNSGYRPWSSGSAHQFGKALDIQPVDQAHIRLWPAIVFESIQNALGEIGDEWFEKWYCPNFTQTEGRMFGFQRAFWEWSYSSGGDGWLHIDREHRDGSVSHPQLWIGYPVSSRGRVRMVYEQYDGTYPWIKAGRSGPAYS